MKQHVGLTVDSRLLKEIETLRGREKRSTFIENLIRLGLKAYNLETKHILTEKHESHDLVTYTA